MESITYTLLSIPKNLLRMIILYACDDKYMYALRRMFLSCHHINTLIAAEWPAIVDRCYHTDISMDLSGRVYNTIYFCGLLHGPRVDDLDTAWYRYGQLHRDGDLPAVMRHDGLKLAWYTRRYLHRDADLPAYYCRYGWRWYKNDKRHRVGGPASVSVTWNDSEVCCLLWPWDGYSDVSVIDFDWGQIVQCSSTEKICIEYEWYENDEMIKNESRKLIELGERLLVGPAE
jgi:hypothetical protein